MKLTAMLVLVSFFFLNLDGGRVYGSPPCAAPIGVLGKRSLQTALNDSLSRMGKDFSAEHVFDHGSPLNNPSGKRAFTLTELLVVVAIIGILTSLLLPALSRARRGPNKVTCINNQRQILLGWHLYSDDNDQRLIPNGHRFTPSRQRPLWVQGNSYEPSQSTNAAFLIDEQYALIAPYVNKTLKIFKCPTDSGEIAGAHGSQQTGLEGRLRSYTMSFHMGTDLQEWDSRMSANYEVFYYQEQISRLMPGGAWVTMCTYDKSCCWPCGGVYMDKNRVFNWPTPQHNGTVMGMSDYSAGWVPFRSAAFKKPKSDNFHDHDDLLPIDPSTPNGDNSDLIEWRKITTVLKNRSQQ